MKPFDSSNILFCDNHLLVVHKPAGIATQPDLCDLAKAWVKSTYHKPGAVFLEPIHRLDKPVSGLVLFARTSKALSRLQQQMREQQIEKTYEAWVEGSLEQDHAILRHRLIHGSHRAEISPHGKEAVLEYTVLERKSGSTQLQIQLHTGRYHQIRAQCAAIGHPILGDTKYSCRAAWKGEGIALKSVRLAFMHPISHEHVEIK